MHHIAPLPATGAREELHARYERVRAFTELICAPLSAEDCTIQSMPDVSPTRWHLAHTTWFFEQFVLARDADYRPFDERYSYLFNSYYNTVGRQFPRPQRRLISRPGLSEVRAYREYVDEQLSRRLSDGEIDPESKLAGIVELGLHHEQQHQELILSDIKHVLSCNPLNPVYRASDSCSIAERADHAGWVAFDEGLYEIGWNGAGFAYDNEHPRHRVFLEAFELARQPVTCGEFLQFIKEGGYRRPELWLSLGWNQVNEAGWHAPLYWELDSGNWFVFTLAGRKPIDPRQPVCHLSYFEADAFARWASARLPTEAEWEVAAAELPICGNLVDALFPQGAAIHPASAPHQADATSFLRRMYGDVWEWTASSYAAYPGYRPPAGALGEYNGKFMCNQYVLRGGSCATSSDHLRPTYRNFFPPDARWQFSGVRLARSLT